MPRTTQLTLSLVSRPGTLATLARTLADAGVNITALSAAEVTGRGKIRLLVKDPVEARRALRKARYRFSEEPAFALRLRNKPGALARVAAGSPRSGSTCARSTPPPRPGAAVASTVGGIGQGAPGPGSLTAGRARAGRTDL